MIPLSTQRYLAHRMNAHVRLEKLDHTPLVTAPDTVVEVILEAASGYEHFATTTSICR